ncbi:M48 family metalloprotease [Krasilnikovia sp. M28-CT-15]|uniref:M48 family metalloprotease n=1 Tax=Krasilnikovia sp. M28-CT-15 TaxID=3373540 RepID=UPI003876F5DE
MTIAVYLPLLLALPLALAVRFIAARGAPEFTARALTLAAAIAATCSTWSLGLLALTLLDDVPPLRALDEHPHLELPEPVPGLVALAAALLLIWAAGRLGRDVHRRIDTHRRLRGVGTPTGELVVADWDTPMAVAVPGRPGHLLVTSGMLRLLDAGERAVVFAHEQAHLRRHHHRLVAVSAAAAAVNPLLVPVREAVVFLVERAADEEAAAQVADRNLAARALARAALSTVPPTVLGISSAATVQRVRALTAPAPAARYRRLAALVLLGVGCLAAAVAATVAFVELAQVWLA